MYSNAQLALKFIKYYLTASNGKGHGIHSPFVYEFVTKILNKKSTPENVAAIEARRKSLEANTTVIEVVDRGAGSRQSEFKIRSISVIAKSALKQKKISQLLYKMGVYFNPSNILEMGTSFGITSSYLAMSIPHQTIVTMEGAPAIAQEAQRTFDLLQLKNIQIMEGDFATSLPIYLNAISQLGMVYIDGNHRYAPTMQYFELLLCKVNEQSILIFDDIYWSSEMEKAWNEIKNHKAVTLTIDLFYVGIVFFRKENKEKQHFTIRY
jgi:predicted O-methyltransferase YrrM